MLKHVQKRADIMRASEQAIVYMDKLKKSKIDLTLESKQKIKLEETKIVKKKDKEM